MAYTALEQATSLFLLASVGMVGLTVALTVGMDVAFRVIDWVRS